MKNYINVKGLNFLNSFVSWSTQCMQNAINEQTGNLETIKTVMNCFLTSLKLPNIQNKFHTCIK